MKIRVCNFHHFYENSEELLRFICQSNRPSGGCLNEVPFKMINRIQIQTKMSISNLLRIQVVVVLLKLLLVEQLDLQ